ncbi:UDP-N-acetylmuramoyl-L-alanyl-D-glutamate--2,6-diaminopimelate ligase [Clostridium botulinum]|uniref:UDP-N-acetylmuramoyl-L-alanyl-D-glutamate--2,6-diaminopimelate ligase n=1 Tax=Clostridium botulinum C/D str. DC5 TaxID=1443128 RepID=A0A0A0IQU5_CLOBO|nr:UDP-N-acetylmuramoyl-L-alanyl-D-glutamate--2,6-diaminopimelate ligase [Clostridium botulinum]KGM96644.1 UDP-N-acetylmuramoylalanyl-D-glutamate--2,6-diaminopimelate ligase [Clostridium botulinum D str. CCUG 7971]KGN01886.1 UDP-N-acetylmuramoylalanyl-D-glutamate--2,6-diaminopimelate ligase [Clostridium botulinum C/D str. DC5]KOC48522.1 UDP-N-acetylmuramoylalanyl-D-glutamate--2,6-diaminopimelate ligase [Clostridium botulinum]KOC55666.1 UDP-N-acetylmuramoylalanyl-D-glutamate--2,6-diaminopimelate
MKLVQILKGLHHKNLNGTLDLDVNKVEYDSRKILNGDVFVAIEGFNVDGHKFIQKAIENGAKVIICSKDIEINKNCTYIKVENTRKALSIIASNFYENPSNEIKLIGITGTNGKTTSTYMIKSILEHAECNTGLIGTIANFIGEEKIKAERTTPESLELHEMFKKMKDKNIEYCIMEVSSHSLSLDRVYGLEFSQGVFTNLTQDHLDFHKTFENYYEAKLSMFNNAKNSIINIDDSYGERMLKDIPNTSIKVTYSTERQADLVAKNIVNHAKGAEFDLVYKEFTIHINLSIPGIYNVYNALCSAAACLEEGISIEKVKEGLENVVVPGRCENVTKKYNLGFDVIVDYAHTPDGLENILNTAKDFTKGRLISVFGCGGDRDKTKRPIMGKIGSNLSDIAIITSDNPRTEEPMSIINDVVSGIDKDNYVVVENRKDAIKEAMRIAKKDDVIVVAGKGHEDYQILKDKVIHFDEREVIADIVKELF